ncbi:MAG: Spy/CpxP family protein refolding chaperone [Planctomycetes bacterium]|nr:Spy/CpxP family protein refolding chaperone [Planctomycetota bacterium]
MKAQLLLGLGGLLLLGAATTAFAQEPERARVREHARLERGAERGEHAGGQRAPGQRAERRHAGGQRAAGQHAGGGRQRGERLRQRVQDAKRFVRSLELTPKQREELRRTRRELAPIAKELRPEIREVLGGARELRRAGRREEAREYLRQELKPLRQEANERGMPLVRPLIDRLTPEQRAKCEERARAHGREFDPDRAAKRLGLFLSAERGHRHGRQGGGDDDGAPGPRSRDDR